jgi:Ulp1 family protease
MRSQMEDADEVSDFLAGIEFADRDWLIVPVNDATSARGGGSHWSLLAFHIASNRALHLDSSAGHNNSEAAKSLASILSSLSSHPPALVQDIDAPVQRDGCSCGVFSCMFAEFLAFKLAHHQQPDFDAFAPAKWLAELCAVVSQDSVGVWREAVVADIERLCAERGR